MSDNINSMNYKQLRNEVQLLRDELAIMKRKYEDIIYNLDTDNFSSRFVKEQGNMKTAIEVNAEGIKTKVSNEDFQSTISQTADNISSIVSEFVDVSDAEEVSAPDDFKDINTVYVIDDTYYYYNALSKQWEVVKNSGMINSLFEQTSQGFKLKGNVRVDGSCVLTDSLTFDSSDNPLQVEYSVDGVNNWHTTFVSGSDKFMRLKIGARWSDAMKIVGSDGQPGAPGSDAVVSKRDVFDMLTAGGTQQGLFTAFYDGGDKLFINAELIQAGILSGITVESIDAYGNAVEMSDGHIQLIPSNYTTSLIDLGMYSINGNWEPRMRFGRGTTSSGTYGTGWIYKTTNGFGMMYNTEAGKALAIEFNDASDAIEIIGDVNFSGGKVSGVIGGGGTVVAVFG